MGEALSTGPESLMDSEQSLKFKSTSIKTLQPAHTATSTQDRQIGAYSFDITIPGKLSCPNVEE
jgi:hypothetical protein